MNSIKSWILKSWDWLANNKYVILTTLMPPLIAISLFMFKMEYASSGLFTPWATFWLSLVIASVICTIWAGIKQNEFKKKFNDIDSGYKQCKNKVDELSQQLAESNEHMRNSSKLLIVKYLKIFSINNLGFKDQDTETDRISIYLHDSHFQTNGVLYQVGRFSFSDYFSKAGRSIYPTNEGAIGKAWNSGTGWEFITDLPDYSKEPDEYSKAQEQFNIDSKTVEKLTMKSRLYCSWRIDDLHGDKLAVIVLESLVPNRYDIDQIKKAWNNSENEFLINMLEVLKPYIVSPSIAKEKGF